MSNKEKLALGAAVASVAAGVAAYAYTKISSDDQDSTEKDSKIEEENYPASKLKNVDELIITPEEPSKEDEVDDASKTKKDAATHNSVVGENKDPSKDDDPSKKEQDKSIESSKGEQKQLKTVDDADGKGE